MTFYVILKWFHLIFTILAVGANLTYGVWISRAAKDKLKLDFALRGVHVLDNRFAVPSYILLLITGLWMVFIGPFSFGNGWLDLSLVLYGILLVILLFVYKPALKKQIIALDDGFDSAEYKSAAKKTRINGIVIAVLVLIILFLMVVKPALWAAN